MKNTKIKLGEEQSRAKGLEESLEDVKGQL